MRQMEDVQMTDDKKAAPAKAPAEKTLKPTIVKFNPRTAKKGDVIAQVVMQED